MVLGVIMGGLALANIVSLGVGLSLVGAPETIILTYGRLADALEKIVLEIPFGLQISNFQRDLIVIWIVISGSNLRTVIVERSIYKNFAEIIDGYDQHNSLTIFSFFSILMVTISGPLYFIFSIFPNSSLKLTRQEYKNMTKIDSSEMDDQDFEYMNFMKKSYRILIKGYLASLIIYILNPLIAAGLLWWNAAEIERLTAGIG